MLYGVAELRGSSIRERTRKLIGIAIPGSATNWSVRQERWVIFERARCLGQLVSMARRLAAGRLSARFGRFAASLSAFQPVVSEAQPLGFLPGSIIRELLRVLTRIQNRQGGGVRDG